MLRSLVRRALLVLLAVVAVALVARALISRFRPAETPPVAWPPVEPTPSTPGNEVAFPPASTSSSSPWVEPDGAACPASHPLKAKLSSGIYHSPGGLNYDRTRPDRCYIDAAAAEADGLRASKR